MADLVDTYTEEELAEVGRKTVKRHQLSTNRAKARKYADRCLREAYPDLYKDFLKEAAKTFGLD